MIRRKLGDGPSGMGEVYYAEDTKLQRPVALKRVNRKLRNDPAARRHILREAQRASALSSEHIASVHDVVEDGEELFLVMEYVEGTTLRRRLESTPRFSLDAFLHVALQCAEALAEAQKKGIVHCDLKPENIMLTGEDHVKILDFGLARRLPVSDPLAMTASAESRMVGCAGTPGYMAPEVWLEQKVDGRTDVFSLGVVFYEMLAGQHPFETKKLIGTADHILHDQPRPMRELARGVPEELERIVGKMLAKDPALRYQSAQDLVADLRGVQGGKTQPRPLRKWLKDAIRPIIASLLVVLALSTIPWPTKPPLPEKKNLAVLPFVPAADDPEARAFSRGLTQTLTAKLTQLTDRYPIQVVSPSEIGKLSTASVTQARSELGVNLVLEGSFHQAGSRVRVVYDVVDASTHRVLRADTVTADVGDPFALEDRVVESALAALELELSTQDRKTLAARGTSQSAAYDFYLTGRGYLQEYQKPENVESAIELFRRALEKDPKFTLAYAGLGESYWQKYEVTHDRAWVAKALEACKSANGHGYTCLGTVYNGTGKYEEAADAFQRALQLDGTNDTAYRGLAFAYEHMGKMEEAERIYRSAIRVRPEYWAGYNWLGGFLYRQGRYQEAAGQFEQVRQLAPDNFRGYNNLSGAYIMLARYADAIPLCERSIQIRPTPDAYSQLGTVYFYLRRFPEAALAYEQAVKMDEHERFLWGNLGDAYYWATGRRQESVAAYRKAIALGEEQLRVNPRDETLLSYLAVYHAMLHEEQAAWAELKQALALAPGNPDVRFNGALVANQLGDTRLAIAWLQQAVGGGLQVDQIRNSPNFDNLRTSKPFQELLREKKPAEPNKRPR
ncbi:MAG TPA: protein kinase [Terriglobales bacterium]|nr:protein kinase [Terriglobales bacterium]